MTFWLVETLIHMARKNYYVEQIGRQFGSNAVAYETPEQAVSDARRSAKYAMRTTVYDCSSGPVGVVIWCTSRGDK